MRLLLPLLLFSACNVPASVDTLESPIVYPTTRSAVRRQADRVRADGNLEIELHVAPGSTSSFAGVRARIDGAAWQDLAGTASGDAGGGRSRWLVIIAAGRW